MATIDATDARLTTHEEICIVRYEAINARLKRLETILLQVAGALLLGMGGVMWTLLTHQR